jgi:hypothetical protein
MAASPIGPRIFDLPFSMPLLLGQCLMPLMQLFFGAWCSINRDASRPCGVRKIYVACAARPGQAPGKPKSGLQPGNRDRHPALLILTPKHAPDVAAQRRHRRRRPRRRPRSALLFKTLHQSHSLRTQTRFTLHSPPKLTPAQTRGSPRTKRRFRTSPSTSRFRTAGLPRFRG